MAEDPTRAEINRLYWGSDDSVGDIADRLGVSRRALYDSIDPRPAGASCGDCGGPLEFRNRTALERREATCPGCGSEERVPREGGEPDPGEDPGIERMARGARLAPVPPRSVPTTASGPVLGGALLAGLAAGAAVGYLLRRS